MDTYFLYLNIISVKQCFKNLWGTLFHDHQNKHSSKFGSFLYHYLEVSNTIIWVLYYMKFVTLELLLIL